MTAPASLQLYRARRTRKQALTYLRAHLDEARQIARDLPTQWERDAATHHANNLAGLIRRIEEVL